MILLKQEVLEEDESHYDIVAPEEVPTPEEIPLTVTEPQDQPKKKNKKEKKKKQKKEVVLIVSRLFKIDNVYKGFKLSLIFAFYIAVLIDS